MTNETIVSIPSISHLEGIFSGMLSKMIIAVLIFLLGFIFGKLVGRVIRRLLNEIELNKFIKRTTGLSIAIEEAVSLMVSYSIYFFTFVISLDQLGLTSIIFYMLTAALLLILVISFFLGVKDFFPNVMAGLYVHQKVRVGDNIYLDKITGEVINTDLIQTQVRTKSGDLIYIPNSMLLKSKIKLKRKK